jgi:hypothetical protein
MWFAFVMAADAAASVHQIHRQKNAGLKPKPFASRKHRCACRQPQFDPVLLKVDPGPIKVALTSRRVDRAPLKVEVSQFKVTRHPLRVRPKRSGDAPPALKWRCIVRMLQRLAIFFTLLPQRESKKDSSGFSTFNSEVVHRRSSWRLPVGAPMEGTKKTVQFQTKARAKLIIHSEENPT